MKWFRNRLPVASHLTDAEYRLLLEVYANHNSNIGLKERMNYDLSKVMRVERNVIELCLNVHFHNGEWFKYYRDGTWG